MTRKELLDRRLSAGGNCLTLENLPSYCDIYRTRSDGRDKAGAVLEARPAVATAVPCGVTPSSDPVEVVVAGRPMGMADGTLALPKGTVVRETDQIHVRASQIAENAMGSPAYATEHMIFTVIGTTSIATHSHLLTVYVARRR